MKTLHKFTTVLLLLSSLGLNAGNPLVPDFGMADPHMYVFDGELYLFTTRDSSMTSKSFNMPDWHIWTTDDMVEWEHLRTIKPSETWMGESTRCWATESATKNGKYYFYFSNGNESTGVMVADKPEGPYKDVLGKPFLPKDLTPTKEYDPGLLIDDDGQAYIVFGHHRSNDDDYYYMIARLGDDMISLTEDPKEIKIVGDVKVLGGNDKPNLHKHNGVYYLSAGSHYAMSENIYGPYTKTGNSGNDTYGLDGKAHGNYFEWNNQTFHTWCHFHLGKEVARFRESYLSYLHYKEDGEMVTDTDFLDMHFATGVGQYDADWGKIEAEWYMKAEGVAKRESPNGGFEIQQMGKGAFLLYPNMKNIDNKSSITFHVASLKGGTIEVFSGSDEAQLIGKCKVPTTGSWTSYQDVKCDLKKASGEDLVIKFKGKGDDILHLDYFKF